MLESKIQIPSDPIRGHQISTPSLSLCFRPLWNILKNASQIGESTQLPPQKITGLQNPKKNQFKSPWNTHFMCFRKIFRGIWFELGHPQNLNLWVYRVFSKQPKKQLPQILFFATEMILVGLLQCLLQNTHFQQTQGISKIVAFANLYPPASKHPIAHVPQVTWWIPTIPRSVTTTTTPRTQHSPWTRRKPSNWSYAKKWMDPKRRNLK